MQFSKIGGRIITVASAIIGAVSLLLGIRQYNHDRGGTLSPIFGSEAIHNNDTRVIFVCLDNADFGPLNIGVVPVFDNPTEFSVRDFSLTYSVESNGISFIPSDLFSERKTGAGLVSYRYSENILYAFTCSESPFSSLTANRDGGRCIITARATYDGAKEPFIYRTDLRVLIVDNSKDLPFEDWKLSCQKAIYSCLNRDVSLYDTFIIGKGKQEHKIGVSVYGSPESQTTVETGQTGREPVQDQPGEKVVQENGKADRATGKGLKESKGSGLPIKGYSIAPDGKSIRFYYNGKQAPGTEVLCLLKHSGTEDVTLRDLKIVPIYENQSSINIIYEEGIDAEGICLLRESEELKENVSVTNYDGSSRVTVKGTQRIAFVYGNGRTSWTILNPGDTYVFYEPIHSYRCYPLESGEEIPEMEEKDMEGKGTTAIVLYVCLTIILLFVVCLPFFPVFFDKVPFGSVFTKKYWADQWGYGTKGFWKELISYAIILLSLTVLVIWLWS